MISIFLQVLISVLMKLSMSQPLGLLKLMRNSFSTNRIERRELCLHDFMKYTFDIVMCQDTCEPICFKLVMMVNTTKLCGLNPV